MKVPLGRNTFVLFNFITKLHEMIYFLLLHTWKSSFIHKIILYLYGNNADIFIQKPYSLEEQFSNNLQTCYCLYILL